MRKVFVLISSTMLILSCSKDSREVPVETHTIESPKTFLEIVDGMSFAYSRGDWYDIFFFTNSDTFLSNSGINRLTGEIGNCYSYKKGVNAKILSNTENGLLIEVNWSSSSPNWTKLEFSLNDTKNFLIYREDFGDPDDVEWYLISDRKVNDFCSD